MMATQNEIEPQRNILGYLVSFEALTSYYVLSGLVKSVLEYYEINLPFDITVILLGLIFLSLINESLSKTEFFKLKNESAILIFLFIMFYSWMVISLIYSPSIYYAHQKVFKFLTNFIFIIIILRGNFNISLFFKISFLLVVLILLWFLPLRFLYISGQSPKGYLFTRNVMGLYLHLSMPLGMFLLFFLTSKFNFSDNRTINQIFYGIALIGMVLLGARGPILFFSLIYALYFIIHGKIRTTFSKNSILISILTISALLILIYIVKDQFSELFRLTIRRFSLFISGLGNSDRDFGNSVNERLEFLTQSIGIIFDSASNFLFGSGIGSFGILTIGEDIRHYPHNFILEIWCELGLIGISIFSLIVIVSVRKIRFSIDGFNIFPVLYILMNFLKSGNMEDMRLLFTILALYFIASHKTIER